MTTMQDQATREKPSSIPHSQWSQDVIHRDPVIDRRFQTHLASGLRTNGQIWYDSGTLSTYNYYGSYPISPEVEVGTMVVVMDDAKNQHSAVVLSWHGDHITYRWGVHVRKARVWMALTGMDGVDEPPVALVGQALAAEKARIDSMREGWEERLGKMAEDEDWCGEFDTVMDRAGLEVVRNSKYEVTVRLHFQISATDVDNYLARMYGGDHDSNDYVDMYSEVTLRDVDKDDTDNENLDHYLRDAGYSGWDGYEMTDSERQER